MAYTVQVENLSNSEELVDNSEEEEQATPVKVQAKGKERERVEKWMVHWKKGH